MLNNIDRCYYQTPGIYAILSNIHGKIYIGSSKDLYKRANQHINHLKQNKHFNQYLQKFYRKYGPESLEIWVLRIFQNSISNKKLREYEQIYVEQFYDNQKTCFNLSSNAMHITASAKGILSQKKKMVQHWKNNREKMLSVTMKNLEKAMIAYRKMIRAGWRQKSWNKGEKASPEAIAKMKASAVRRGRNRVVPINMYDKNWYFVKSYQCAIDAALELSDNYKLASNITAVCRGRRLAAFGYYWKYSDIVL